MFLCKHWFLESDNQFGGSQNQEKMIKGQLLDCKWVRDERRGRGYWENEKHCYVAMCHLSYVQAFLAQRGAPHRFPGGSRHQDPPQDPSRGQNIEKMHVWAKSRGTLRCWFLVPHPRKQKIHVFRNWSPDPWEPIHPKHNFLYFSNIYGKWFYEVP